MPKLLKNSFTWAISIITVIFSFFPETTFGKYKLFLSISNEANVILMRFLTFIAVLVLSIFINALYVYFRRSVLIKGKNYSIQIEYGNIFEICDCKKIIPFDECFTTSVGNNPSDINEDSICGQYLKANPIENMQTLIDYAELKPLRSKSRHQGRERYESGKLVPNGSDLLLAFTKLDEEGLGKFSYDEFLACLSTLWKEIDKHYGQKDVCMPILGAGTTRIINNSLKQQELLDIIIGSYKLSPYKIKNPYRLRIVCKKFDDFSINKIGENI